MLIVADIRRQVERVIETDPVIKKGLQRRIINSRALARYILEAKGVDSTLDAILGIVRRYPLGSENDNRHQQVFKDCEIATRNKVADLAVENGQDIMRRIADFCQHYQDNQGRKPQGNSRGPVCPGNCRPESVRELSSDSSAKRDHQLFQGSC